MNKSPAREAYDNLTLEESLDKLKPPEAIISQNELIKLKQSHHPDILWHNRNVDSWEVIPLGIYKGCNIYVAPPSIIGRY